jgi:hypothetical protein
VAEPLECPICPLLADAVQLTPPTSRAVVPERGNLRDDLAAEALAAGVIGTMRAARTIPGETRINARRSQRAHRREPAVGAQVLPVLPHGVPRPGQRVGRTGASPPARHRERKRLAAVLAALIAACFERRVLELALRTSKLSRTAHCLAPQAESQTHSTARAANAGRRRLWLSPLRRLRRTHDVHHRGHRDPRLSRAVPRNAGSVQDFAAPSCPSTDPKGHPFFPS